MIIKSITIGGWFQRTTLHLTELYNFFNGNSISGLDTKVLQKNLKSLNIVSIDRIAENIEHLDIAFKNNFRLKIFEDGLTTLSVKVTTNDLNLLKKEIEKLRNFYEGPLSNSFSYIFSRGAPVPKELAKIENVYPFIIETETKSLENTLEIFEHLGDKIHSIQESSSYKICKGKKIMTVANILDEKMFRLFAESEIFFREFKTQLARYLHIHREIWEKINQIKSKNSFSGSEVMTLREEIQEEQKTINLIEARINQMPVYFKTRSKLCDVSAISPEFQKLFQFKFETLLNTHDYVKSLWGMTKNYLSSANDMLGVMQNESNKSSISSLTIITTIGVVAGIVNYLVRDSLPKITLTGVVYFAILIFITFLINLGVTKYYQYKKYNIKK